MNPTTVICLLCAVPLSLAICFAVYALVQRRRKAAVCAVGLTIISVALPVAYFFHVQNRIKQYVEQLGSENEQPWTSQELAKTGSWAVPPLIELLDYDHQNKRDSGDQKRCMAAIRLLGKIGAQAEAAIPKLQQRTESNTDPIETLWVHSALARIDDSPGEHVSILIDALQEDDPPGLPLYDERGPFGGGAVVEVLKPHLDQQDLSPMHEIASVNAAVEDAYSFGTFGLLTGFGNLRLRLNAAQALRAANQGRAEVEAAAKRADEAGLDIEAAGLRAILTAWDQGI